MSFTRRRLQPDSIATEEAALGSSHIDLPSPEVDAWQKPASADGRSGLFKNLLFMALWQGANYLAPILTFPYLARTLSPLGFGELGLSLLVSGWMIILSDWGTNLSGSRVIAAARAQRQNISLPFWEISALRLVATATILLAVVLAFGLHIVDGHQAGLLAASWGMALGNCLTVSWCLQGLERMDGFATAAMIGKFATIPATIFLVKGPSDVLVAILIQAAGANLIAVVSMFFLLLLGAIRPARVTPHGIARQATEALPAFLSVLSHGMYSSTAALTLGWQRGQIAVGMFACAERIRLSLQALIAPIYQAFFPRLSRLVIQAPYKAKRTLRMLLALHTIIGLTIASVLGLESRQIIRLIGGAAYGEAAPALALLGSAAGLFCVNNVLGYQALLAFGHKRRFARVTTAAAVVNAVLVLPLVVTLGIKGAALTVCLTEGFMTVCYGVLAWRHETLTIEVERQAGPI